MVFYYLLVAMLPLPVMACSNIDTLCLKVFFIEDSVLFDKRPTLALWNKHAILTS